MCSVIAAIIVSTVVAIVILYNFNMYRLSIINNHKFPG